MSWKSLSLLIDEYFEVLRVSVRGLALVVLLLLPTIGLSHEANRPPELWSWFKALNKSSAAGKIQSVFILEKIGVKNLVENEYGIYGVFKNNRISVKCVEDGEDSQLWVAVAGMDRDSVELLRNKIVKDIK